MHNDDPLHTVLTVNNYRGGLGRLAAWHLPDGPVGPGEPPRQMLKEEVERRKGPGGFSLDILFAGAP